jgi:hypothetical protein
MRLVRSPNRPSVREIDRHTWTVELPGARLNLISVGFCTKALKMRCQYHIHARRAPLMEI